MDAMLDEFAAWAAIELPDARRDKTYLKRFLYGCKMRQDVAKRKYRNFHEMRQNTPQWFSGRDPTHATMAELLDLGVFLPLPKKDEEGRTVIVVRATLHNPRVIAMSDVFKVGMMVLDLALEVDEGITEHGVQVIIDLQGVGGAHGMQMTPTLVRRAVHSWQDCYPIRIASIHFINCPIYINVVFNLFRQFMREKLKQRVHTHGKDLSALHRLVDKQLLPEEYQGTNGRIGDCVHQWKKAVTDKRDWFLAQEVNVHE